MAAETNRNYTISSLGFRLYQLSYNTTFEGTFLNKYQQRLESNETPRTVQANSTKL